MISFSEFIKNKKRVGVIPMPIHFKHVGSSINEGWFEDDDNMHLSRRVPIRKQIGNIKVDQKQKKAIKSYTFDSKDVNRKLISNPNAEHPLIPHLDNVIKNNPIPKSLSTYSAIGFNPTQYLDEKRQFRSPAYISSTPVKDVAFSFTKKLDDGIHHIAHFELSEGDPATHIAEHSSNQNEEETLVSRNITLQHNGSHDFKDGGDRYRVHRFTIVR